MLNNKAYVLTPVLLLLFFIIALLTHFYLEAVNEVVYKGIILEIIITKHNYALNNYVQGFISAEALRAYQILSKAKSLSDLDLLVSGSTTGFSISNEGVVIFVYVYGQNVSEPWINSSILPFETNKTLFYPINLFLSELDRFDSFFLQNCLNSLSCSYKNFRQVLNACLNAYSSELLNDNLRLINHSSPMLSGQFLTVGLGLISEENITRLFPYDLGTYSFNC